MTRIWVPGYDEVLELFDQYKKQSHKIEQQKDKLMSICWKQTSYLKRDPVKAYQEVPALQKYIEAREEEAEELCKQIDKGAEIKGKVFALLETIDGIERDVIIARYHKRMSWVQVMFEIRELHDVAYTERNLMLIHDQAIAKMAAQSNK
jgi:hypothetical protein